ncbi:MAG: OmpA family protein [Phycisphaerales bacterium]|nr:OmpA family protein [Phycisphaerales bacterium]
MSLFSGIRRGFLPALLGIACLTAGLGGCVNQGEYDRLYETNRGLTDRNATLQRERDDALAARDMTRQQLAKTEAALAALQAQNDELMRRMRESGLSLADLEARLKGLSVSPLDADTDALLRELAAQYPDLLKYDDARGMLRFASDLTFASGSDQIQPQAQAAIAALAGILKNPVTAKYEVIVVGHTDAQRISANTAKRFPTNVHLSAGRAISVRAALVGDGVVPGKMQVAGWGEFRPLVPNTSSGNTPQNRRVEIYLMLPKNPTDITTMNESVPSDSGPTTAAPNRSSPPARAPEITK